MPWQSHIIFTGLHSLSISIRPCQSRLTLMTLGVWTNGLHPHTCTYRLRHSSLYIHIMCTSQEGTKLCADCLVINKSKIYRIFYQLHHFMHLFCKRQCSVSFCDLLMSSSNLFSSWIIFNFFCWLQC